MAPKEIGLSVLAVENVEILASDVIPPPKVKVEVVLWAEIVVADAPVVVVGAPVIASAPKAMVVGAPKAIDAFGSDPNEGDGLLNDEFALPSVGGCGDWNAVDGLPNATEATD